MIFPGMITSISSLELFLQYENKKSSSLEARSQQLYTLSQPSTKSMHPTCIASPTLTKALSTSTPPNRQLLHTSLTSSPPRFLISSSPHLPPPRTLTSPCIPASRQPNQPHATYLPSNTNNLPHIQRTILIKRRVERPEFTLSQVKLRPDGITGIT